MNIRKKIDLQVYHRFQNLVGKKLVLENNSHFTSHDSKTILYFWWNFFLKSVQTSSVSDNHLSLKIMALPPAFLKRKKEGKRYNLKGSSYLIAAPHFPIFYLVQISIYINIIIQVPCLSQRFLNLL